MRKDLFFIKLLIYQVSLLFSTEDLCYVHKKNELFIPSRSCEFGPQSELLKGTDYNYRDYLKPLNYAHFLNGQMVASLQKLLGKKNKPGPTS